MLKVACLWSIFANYNAMLSVCKIWLIFPEPGDFGICLRSSTLPRCAYVSAQEEATDGIQFCYKHQLTLHE